MTAAGAAPRTFLQIIQEKNRRAGQAGRGPRGPAIRRERGGTDLPAEQGRRDDSRHRAVASALRDLGDETGDVALDLGGRQVVAGNRIRQAEIAADDERA